MPRYHVFFESEYVDILFEVVCDYGDAVDMVRDLLKHPLEEGDETGIRNAKILSRIGARHHYQIDRIGVGDTEEIVRYEVLRESSNFPYHVEMP